jgi:hypothetical protein
MMTMMMMNGYVKPQHNKKRDSSLFSFVVVCGQKTGIDNDDNVPFFEIFIQTTLFLLLFFLFIYLLFVRSLDERKMRVSACEHTHTQTLTTREKMERMNDEIYIIR